METTFIVQYIPDGMATHTAVVVVVVVVIVVSHKPTYCQTVVY